MADGQEGASEAGQPEEKDLNVSAMFMEHRERFSSFRMGASSSHLKIHPFKWVQKEGL